ncbi:MAG: hypothetical protein IOC86_09460 [Aestuariivirga sp.]|jgi:hypothetical protein|nr:hypothetical protein [Aestuariivirga sp.]
MSPVGYIVLKILRGGALASAGFVLLVIGIELWKQGGDVTGLEPGFTVLLCLILAGALWLARAIGRELSRHGS